MPHDHADLPSETGYDELCLRSDGTYLFVGGLVRDDDPFVLELQSLGCTVTRVSGDVTIYEDVARAVRAAGRPIVGVLQASMILQDTSLNDMSWTQWTAASRPKIQGTWNLHNALLHEQADHPVDHFLLFSSLGAMTGQWGQANYNAGNTFLDAFVSYRHSLGLAASVVNIGVVGDVGYVSENPSVLDSLRATGQYLMREPELLDCLELKRAEGELDLDAPLGAVGIDSLVSIELRNWIRRTLGAEVSVLEIARVESRARLGETVQGKLIEKYQARR
ncbi:hypothetical protein KVR01_008311 [Diaporthe batatas]|uniref:uncharacterized protein n=1 Tax=Diaporthe batatas TaxID=748121 RepID=UPI001D05AB3A|nr:uncharacterized protein KVR01_008311 [Diaporthe batatas]KAG8162546.1 hypothetical protein KVR01_008311 [Diaporthe batatas]